MNPGLLSSDSGHTLGNKLTRKLSASKWVTLCASKNSPGKLSHFAFAGMIHCCPLKRNEREESASARLHI